ncbi:hypothetical protein A3D83_02760 [Candidatus Daviesbacteria bacterium RIFCSPHIGHO2_02_FULL_41_10]|uniref:Glycosyltransferase 2-like domain-containing protein n=2 Tax=Candidatus Daviesiibacteriota TaxID=1752718 RepID=A0A1F5IQY6_9BACT|nr:MAG: hypothetical protein A2871_02090 [Candidatus Daviesbacteria bacterium RIFCSPHIGHO2_01_FULL_41_23]OGE33049.1 MAG: hypothetical protein A3D83_02760 [Candidatus Daviesbacteria bacterium RIFCSPHIGHO2_02_FULL_41_10]
MYAKKLRIASVIVTYNRIDEAKAQMDIIRELWQPMFESIDLYHEFNGKTNWYPEKYKEDFLHRHKSMSHFVGANHMLNQGIKHVLESPKKYDYIIATSADTWFYNPDKLKKVILAAHKKRAQLAASLWAGLLLGTEFFIVTPDLARRIFPLKFTLLTSRYKLLQWAHLSKIGILETIFTLQVIRVLKNPNKIYLIPGRRAVWPTNRFWSPNFYASHHDRIRRKKDLMPFIRNILGKKIENMPSLNEFLSS